MSFSDQIENDVLNEVFGATAFSPSATYWVGLSTADPLDDGSGITEPSGANGYARVSVNNDKVTWTTSSAGSLTNDIQIEFPEATGSWGTITHFFISIDSTSTLSADLVAHGALDTSRAIASGDIARFDVGEITITLD